MRRALAALLLAACALATGCSDDDFNADRPPVDMAVDLSGDLIVVQDLSGDLSGDFATGDLSTGDLSGDLSTGDLTVLDLTAGDFTVVDL